MLLMAGSHCIQLAAEADLINYSYAQAVASTSNLNNIGKVENTIVLQLSKHHLLSSENSCHDPQANVAGLHKHVHTVHQQNS